MTRKKNFEERHLNPETKRGIGIILLFAFSTFLLLAFFHIAGTAGNTLDNVMSFILGWDRFLFPLLLLLFGFIILFSFFQRTHSSFYCSHLGGIDRNNS